MESPDGGEDGGAASGFRQRALPEEAETADREHPVRQWLRWPTKDEVVVAGSVGTAADSIAIATHAASGAEVSVISSVVAAAVAVIMYGRKRWAERKKNGDRPEG